MLHLWRSGQSHARVVPEFQGSDPAKCCIKQKIVCIRLVFLHFGIMIVLKKIGYKINERCIVRVKCTGQLEPRTIVMEGDVSPASPECQFNL